MIPEHIFISYFISLNSSSQIAPWLYTSFTLGKIDSSPAQDLTTNQTPAKPGFLCCTASYSTHTGVFLAFLCSAPFGYNFQQRITNERYSIFINAQIHIQT